MKRVCAVIAVCALGAACGGQSLTGPTQAYELTGTIRDLDGVPLRGVTVLADEGRSAVSDADGRYRFTDLPGGATHVTVYADGYVDWSMVLYIAKGQQLDIDLTPVVILVPGTTLRGIVRSAPCDPQHWDANAPCHIIYFTAPASGTLDLELAWIGSSDLDLFFDGLYWSSGGRHEIRATIRVTGGRRYTIRIDSYYEMQAFELRSEFHPTL